jgi:hypothetical protein
MTTTRHLVLTAGLLGLGAIGVGSLTHGGTLTVPGPERAALRGARAAAHEELERRESITHLDTNRPRVFGPRPAHAVASPERMVAPLKLLPPK